MALTQEQLAAFAKDRAAGYYTPDGSWISQSSGGIIDPLNDKMHIGNYNASGMPDWLLASQGRSADDLTYGNGGISGSGQRGDQYSIMDSSGVDTGQKGTYSSTTGSDMAKLAATYMAILASAGAAGGMFAGAGVNPVMSGASNTGFAGGGAAGVGGTGVMGAGGSDGLLNGLNGSDIMSDAFVSNGGYGAGGFGGTSGSYMSNLLSGTGDLGSRVMGGTGAGSTAAGTAASTAASGGSGLLGKALGIGSTLLGAAAGAKGQEASSTQTRDIPEWLKPYVTKQLGYASGLLDKQMAPGYMQGYDDMRSVGPGLLNQPVAGNGFAQFQAMPRFGR